MKNPKMKLIAQRGRYGLDICLEIGGINHYLAARRSNRLLYRYLKNGKTIGELSRVKPCHSRKEQKKFHYVQRLLKIAKDYLRLELPTRQYNT